MVIPFLMPPLLAHLRVVLLLMAVVMALKQMAPAQTNLVAPAVQVVVMVAVAVRVVMEALAFQVKAIKVEQILTLARVRVAEARVQQVLETRATQTQEMVAQGLRLLFLAQLQFTLAVAVAVLKPE